MIICKKEYRLKRYSLHALVALFSIFFVSCEWVNDDLSGCKTGTWLRFSYTYNILDVDAACSQVNDLSIFIFDNQGKFIAKQQVDSLYQDENGAYVEVEQPQGEYSILVWGGLIDDDYIISELKEGETVYDDVVVELYKNSEADENSSQLNSLFHCSLDNVSVTEEYNIIDAPLVKNTNYFSVLIQTEDDGLELHESDFGIVIRSDNGVLDHKNNIIENNYVNYTPYKQFIDQTTNTFTEGATESSSLFAAYLNTSRLMVDGVTSLSITHLATEDVLVDISLVKYLLLTQGHYGVEHMKKQEYLDRQDSYSLIFFIKESDDASGSYICTQLSVNGWIIRFVDVEL